MSVLTLIDLAAIQRYVFGSSRLRDVVGASVLVDKASGADGLIARCGVAPERILRAAGATVAIHSERLDDAEAVAARFSRLLLDSAPGLEATIVHREASGSLAQELPELERDGFRAKQRRRPGAPLLGVGVTDACTETGLPAVELCRIVPGARISAPIAAARDAVGPRDAEHSQRWVHEGIPISEPLELDHLGRTRGTRSLIGVVHIDGNGVGKMIQRWLSANYALADDELQARQREWSDALQALGEGAREAIEQRLLDRIEERDGRLRVRDDGITGFALTPVDEHDKRAGCYLPLRGVLLGGDDLTFITDGRVALDLAVTAMRAFDAAPALPWIEEQVNACAGVAIVPSHAPFWSAYDLADDLCASAKRRAADADPDRPPSALDWHIGLPRPGSTVAAIRAREYASGRLTCRPYLLGDDDHAARAGTWTWLERGILEPLRSGEWERRRSKVKALPGLLREGGSAVERALLAWRRRAPDLDLPACLGPRNGFLGDDRTPLIDAEELLDLHLSLEGATGP